ncbi:MAG: ORF6N domain-containing protein, partial [Ginsengibacter sp.]
YLPYAFTEHGVTMLASILKSPIARKMNIAIVRAFIALRKFAIEYKDILEQLDGLKDRISGHDAQLNQIYEALENMLDKKADEELKLKL